MRTSVLPVILAALCLASCDRGEDPSVSSAPWDTVATEPRPVPVATASSIPVGQDPSKRIIGALDRLSDVAPDFREEVARAASCRLAETGMPVSAAMIGHLEAQVRLNGGRAPACRARNYASGSASSGPSKSAP